MTARKMSQLVQELLKLGIYAWRGNDDITYEAKKNLDETMIDRVENLRTFFGDEQKK